MMFPIAGLILLSEQTWQALLSATLMMTICGIVTAIVLRQISVRSWRLRSWLVAAVLVQGVMLVRVPVHLGWIDPAPVVTTQLAREWSEDKLLVREIGVEDQVAIATDVEALFDVDGQQNSTSAGMLVRRIDWMGTLGRVWLLGATALFLLAAIGYLRLVHLVNRLNPAPIEWQRQWDRIVKQSTRSRQVPRCELLVSQSVGPLIVRLPNRYAMIVPESYWKSLGQPERRGVMIHELSHLQRRDVWRQLLARSIATIHWFNPVAWWALRQYEQASEWASDSRVASHGKEAAAGFASALVELVQWHQQQGLATGTPRTIGCQAMAAPPLNTRISRLLKPTTDGDSPMKRSLLALFACAVIAISFVQFRLTKAQEGEREHAALEVMNEQVAAELGEISSRLDTSDPTTERFAALMESTGGKLAISGYLNHLRGRALESARSEAGPRFLAKYFVESEDGQLGVRGDSKEAMERMVVQSQRLADNMRKIETTTSDLASRMDTESEASGLMKRLLDDPQAPAAILLFEMKGSGDVIVQFLSKALEKFLVDGGDGTLQVVESRREDAEARLRRLEMAEDIAKHLERELPVWADEIAETDDAHKKLVRYLRNPLTASVASLHLAKENVTSAGSAVNKLFEQLEKASTDTPNGLQIVADETWANLDEIYRQVDRAQQMLPKVQERMAEFAERLSQKDDLSARLAAQMRRTPLAVQVSAELPYADADPGAQLRDLLSQVLTENDDKQLTVVEDRADEVAEKARELLKVCRAIRRHVRNVDETLQRVQDREWVERMGDAGRYHLLSEARRFAESQRPNVFALMTDDLLAATDNNKFRVREDRHEVIRQLVEQAEQVRDEAGNNDF